MSRSARQLSRPLRVGLITTFDWNIGDDLIRSGIVRLLQALAGRNLELVGVNKHHPLTVYPSHHPAWLADRLPPFRGRARLWQALGALAPTLGASRFDECDLIIQCGTPVAYPAFEKDAWAGPLWRNTVGRLHRQIPALNLAAGSCYAYEAPPARLAGTAAAFLREMIGYCRLTTARDQFFAHLAAAEGLSVPVLPCTAFLALGERPTPTAPRPSEGAVLINYMRAGGHFDLGQGLDAAAWEGQVKGLIARLRGHERLVLLCHNAAEARLASELAPDLPQIMPRTPAEYHALTYGAKAAICNRLHAAVSLAGAGIPAIAIGTDTRLGMVETLGVPAFFVKTLDSARLEAAATHLLNTQEAERARLLALREATWQHYLALLGPLTTEQRGV